MCGRYGLVYLAAAVSDFYTPWSKLPEHKIQSGKLHGASAEQEGLALALEPVPKMLG